MRSIGSRIRSDLVAGNLGDGRLVEAGIVTVVFSSHVVVIGSRSWLSGALPHESKP